jgi:hypothetical protein
MSGCNSCSGNCGSCGGCANQLELTTGEIRMLQTLEQIPFLPVARRADDMTPIYLEEQTYSTEEYSLILQCLEKKGLISLSYDKPLGDMTNTPYAAYPIQGSISLTERGYNVLETLEYYGIPEEN